MQKLMTQVLACLMAGLACTATHAQDLSGSVSMASNHKWRGYKLAAQPVLQPELSVQAGRFGASAWMSLALGERATTVARDEIELTLRYDPPAPRGVRTTVGTMVYVYPDQPAFSAGEHVTAEVFAATALDVALHPRLALYYDFLLGNGLYADASAAHTLSTPLAAITLKGALGYDAGQRGVAPTFTHARLAASTALALRRVTLTPFAAHGWGLRPGGLPGWTFGVTARY